MAQQIVTFDRTDITFDSTAYTWDMTYQIIKGILSDMIFVGSVTEDIKFNENRNVNIILVNQSTKDIEV